MASSLEGGGNWPSGCGSCLVEETPDVQKVVIVIAESGLDSQEASFPAALSYPAQTSQVETGNPWVGLDATKHRALSVTDVVTGNTMPVNTLDIESATLLCGTDGEQIYTIRNLVIRWREQHSSQHESCTEKWLYLSLERYTERLQGVASSVHLAKLGGWGWRDSLDFCCYRMKAWPQTGTARWRNSTWDTGMICLAYRLWTVPLMVTSGVLTSERAVQRTGHPMYQWSWHWACQS